jgi:hypothetical protein
MCAGGGGVTGFGRLRAPTARRLGLNLTPEAFEDVELPLWDRCISFIESRACLATALAAFRASIARRSSALTFTRSSFSLARF